ncbi:peptide ABC transporter permease [Stakelama tenebrarum]|uniref:Peptide ABC transporter permease n=1 Tax=Stakelama tenebrarum TaxID=2711215 RepID=A0A6G6Y5V8_9SPHN|nr:peptide ABC transporter permease [Sphingosinithalassobacter tenebrarum]QIG80231.1 peptide ABC transporter permease [Sphingosinithalassobacter tenebrarum]
MEQKRTKDEATHISSRDARGGTIILKHRDERLLFVSGLAAMVLLAAIATVIGVL